MISKQRVREALAHRQPDAVPFDMGSSATTGIHCSCVAALREHFGLEAHPVKVHEPYQMLGMVEDDLMEVLGIDIQGVLPRSTIFGFPNENWKEWRTPWRQVVLVSEHFQTTGNDAGDQFIYPQGDTTAPPSGHMPASGYFFDAIIRQPPINEDELDPADNLEEFGPISKEELAHIQREVQAAASTDRAIMLVLPGMGLGDIALVPAPFMPHPKGIRDVAEWYMSTAVRSDYVHAIFDQQTRVAMGNLEKIFAAVGNVPDVVFICGTDFGTQQSTFCSPRTFRELYLPYYRRMTDWIHQQTTWKVFKHSCGSVTTLLDAFLDAGFDVLNPVQCSATGMAPSYLKNNYGDKLTFWGGGIDTQQVLPFGTPEQVREQTLERCETFATGGGFVFNTIHNIQARTPLPNLLAMFDALAAFNGKR